ncbi:MAG TPA: PGPGW domain-containing protein [Vicinamibacterales bacterium]|nr:PGPGW domain-containing protein [Vicinamibacterales bacterium]
MRTLRITGGFALLVLGVVMVVTPGPGWVAIAAGVSLLAKEYDWARRWRDRLQGRLRAGRHKLTQHFSRS